MKETVCEDHDVKFPSKNGLKHHIKEIHYGLSIDQIERSMWIK